MDITRAKEILEGLADGVNPLTGEILPPTDSCNQADVVRAIHAVLATISVPKVKSQPLNAGKPWTKAEEDTLITEFESGMGISAIAKLHERSKGAIETRLVSLGKIEETYFTKRLR